jgi:hypothetical protein
VTGEQAHGEARGFLAIAPGTRQRWLFFYIPAFIIGAFLRLYGLSNQIMIDDEWHSLNFVIDKSFWTLLTRVGSGANSIPENIYAYALLHTAGWSEMLLRLPSIVCGLGALLVFPLMVLKLYNRFAAIVFAWLLALSPCVIFYSRLCRPYSMVLFFGFLSLLSLFLWLRKGGVLPLLLYALSGSIAIYYHLYASIFVVTPLVCLFALKIVEYFSPQLMSYQQLPSFRMLSLAGGIIAALCLLLVPANFENPWWNNVLGKDKVTVQSFVNFMAILSGTHIPILTALFIFSAVLGIFVLLRNELPVGIIVLSIVAVYVSAVCISKQESIHAAIQIARYGIILFPLTFLLVATAFCHIFGKKCPYVATKYVRYFAAALFIGGLSYWSPLWRTYTFPNNFTNHSAFQDSYKPTDWSESRTRDLTLPPPYYHMKKKYIPTIYSLLSAMTDVAGIVEYPMFIGDDYNQYYYYQHFHRKRMAAGYCPICVFPQLSIGKNDLVFTNVPVDYVVNRADASYSYKKIRFRNIAPITRIPFLSERYHGWVLILHRHLIQEMFPEKNIYEKEDPYEDPYNDFPWMSLEGLIAKEFGTPMFSDDKIVAWRIQ